MTRACVADRALEVEVACLAAFVEDGGEPGLVVVEEANHGTAHRFGKGLVLGGEHPAETHPLRRQDVGVQRRVGVELGCGVIELFVDRCQRGGESVPRIG